MSTLSDDRKRILFPRWRGVYNRSSSIILSAEKEGEIDRSFLASDLEEKKNVFLNDNSFGNALEVVNTAFSMGNEKDAIEEANFINSLKRNLPSALNKIVQHILKEEDNFAESSDNIEDPLLSNIFKESGKKVSQIRKRIQKFYYNPLLWLELSRMYAILGYLSKAEAASQVALQLSNNSNRLITRSVSRFYIHKKDFEKAQSIIRASPHFRKDPWLLSCDIAYSQSMKRRSTSVKDGMILIESKSFSKKDLTELAAALATEKFLSEKDKEGRLLFKLSLDDPNENSFAQAEFFLKELAEKTKLINKIPNNHEAQALELFGIKSFSESYKHSFQWLLDQPFSRRAAHFNSYLLSGIIENHEKAIEVGKFSLRSNPASFLLNNNVAYSYAALNNTKLAKAYLKKARQNIVKDHEKVIISATEGMILYREGNAMNDETLIVKGRDLYVKAINDADSQKNRSLKIMVLLNYTREEFLSNKINKETLEKLILNIGKSDLEKEEIRREVGKLKTLLSKK